MRTCRFCGEPIWWVECKGFGTFWLTVESQYDPDVGGSAVCYPNVVSDRDQDDQDDHEPEPFDLPPTLAATDVATWLSS